MAVSKFRITAARLQSYVHVAARDTDKVMFVPPLEMRGMAGAMLFRQALTCMREGKVIGRPTLTEEGFWEFRMERFGANQWSSFKVAASMKGARIDTLYVYVEED